MNFTVQVSSSLSLVRGPTWSRLHAGLPKDSHVMNYVKDRNNYTSLIINKTSYYHDSGLYYLNTSNYCGPSSVHVILEIYKGNMDSNRILCYTYT